LICTADRDSNKLEDRFAWPLQNFTSMFVMHFGSFNWNLSIHESRSPSEWKNGDNSENIYDGWLNGLNGSVKWVHWL